MDKKKNLGVVGTVIAVIVAVIGVSMVWAAYTASLNIKGSGTVKGAKWSVIFTDLGSANVGNDNGMTVTAKEVTAPLINGDTSIETYSVELQTPGDYVTYNFKIKNNGDFPAKIDSGFAMPEPSCAPLESSQATETDATNVCKNITYTLTYVDGGAAVQSGNTFAVGESKEVQLKIYYNKNATTSELPTDDVTVTNLNITIPFVQY